MENSWLSLRSRKRLLKNLSSFSWTTLISWRQKRRQKLRKAWKRPKRLTWEILWRENWWIKTQSATGSSLWLLSRGRICFLAYKKWKFPGNQVNWKKSPESMLMVLTKSSSFYSWKINSGLRFLRELIWTVIQNRRESNVRACSPSKQYRSV